MTVTSAGWYVLTFFVAAQATVQELSTKINNECAATAQNLRLLFDVPDDSTGKGLMVGDDLIPQSDVFLTWHGWVLHRMNSWRRSKAGRAC